jgi:hypothetical protein
MRKECVVKEARYLWELPRVQDGWLGLFLKRNEHNGLAILDMGLRVINSSNDLCPVPDILDRVPHQITEPVAASGT